MPLVDIVGAAIHLVIRVVEWGVRRWPALAGAYILSTLFGFGQQRKWAALRNVAILILGPVAVYAAYRRSRKLRWVVKVAALAGWLWILRLVDWPGRVIWLGVTAGGAFTHATVLFGWRSIWHGVPLNPRTYRQARRDRAYLRALRHGGREVQGAEARTLFTDPASGVMVGTGRPAPGKSPGQVVIDGNDQTLGNAVNIEAELVGLDPVNVHVETAKGADGGVTFTMWSPDRHPLNRDLRWKGPPAAGPDDPVPLGVTIRGEVYTVPAPGVGGDYLLVGGSTGSGKTTTVNVLLAELAVRPHTDFVICDPKEMDYSWLWGDRALHIAEGPEDASQATALVYGEMRRRRRWGKAHRLRSITPGAVHDPDRCDVCQLNSWSDRQFSRLHLVIDESADIAMSKATFEREGKKVSMAEEFHYHTQRIAATGRACAIGQVICTQSPKATVVPMMTRENCRVRLCFATEEPEQTDAILGTQRIPAHSALSLKGECFGKQSSSIVRWRGWYASDAQLEDVIAGSAHLKGANPISMEVTA